MNKYIDCEALPQKKERGFFLDDDFNAGWNACLNKISAIPAADVRPVVLCRDCVYSSSWYRDKRLCTLWNEDGIDVFEDGFCNYGTKSDNEKQQKNKVDYLVCLTKMQTNICPNCGARIEES